MRRDFFALVCLAVVLSTAVSFAYERRVGLGIPPAPAALRRGRRCREAGSRSGPTGVR